MRKSRRRGGMRESAGCRNHLMVQRSEKPGLAAWIPFLSRQLSFRGLILVGGVEEES
jgi:hypothetical protein